MFVIPRHCEEHSDVAIPRFLGDCQEVNCPKGAREATLGCTSVRTGSQ